MPNHDLRAFESDKVLLTDGEHLPYTLAIHAGEDADGHEHNPPAHLIFSERRNDGIERSRQDWFNRANSEHPEQGGAPKSRTSRIGVGRTSARAMGGIDE